MIALSVISQMTDVGYTMELTYVISGLVRSAVGFGGRTWETGFSTRTGRSV